ncbi:DUF4403 family protein [Spirosoma pollinicola]|uniref:DUF4403 domain-containing protein n=1 Tax=Spirosoma pollinicola TaxID=2057025 RepID=A0A2K8Z1V8_9BACT|nr:DUF4403 family protein [Spirosoma pollinicola]AUD03819.1 hypothetical protein CWM47_19490 [Spirosoma pollinicola]
MAQGFGLVPTILRPLADLIILYNTGQRPENSRHKARALRHQIGVALCLSLFILSCQPSGNKLNPKAPKEVYNTTRMEVQNERFLSTAHVPVSIALGDVERQINAQVNGLIYEDNSLDDNHNDQFMTKVWKRGTILVNAQDSLFHFTVPLRIWVKAGVSLLGFTQYKETEFEIDLRFKTKFDLDKDWSVNTHTEADGYGWVRRPTVSVVGLNIPITNLVGRMIDKNLGSITKTLDQQVRRNIDLRTPVLKVWNTLREPYLISEKYRTYLQVVPKRLLITPLRFEGRVIRATIGIEGFALTTTGDKPDVKPAVSLPDLTVVSQVNDDFRIGLLSEASYQEAAKLAADEFVGKTFSFSENRYTITITDMDMYGQNDNLIIKAGLKGTINGDIYLSGRPYYDADSQTISLRDLKYDLDTRNILQQSASWLLKGTFARTLEKQFTIPIGSQLADMQKLLQERLKNNQVVKGVTINGRIDEIKPDQVYLTPTAMLAVVNARGRIDVKVEGLQ